MFEFISREWILSAVISGLAITSIYLGKAPHFSASEVQVIFILWLLFIVVRGIENSGVKLWLSQNIEMGRLVPLKLVAITFLLSALVTNDAALIVMVPLTLSLDTTRKDILVILNALAANAGAALTPFGNPQNLFIYWYYQISPVDFFISIAPFSIFFLLLLVITSLAVKTKNINSAPPQRRPVSRGTAYIYGGLLLLVVLIILHLLPISAGLLVPAYALVADHKSLRVDYLLLITFISLFGLAENIKSMIEVSFTHTDHIFILSALSSQIIGNVPTAMLFAKFTTQYKALLWGTNVGGFGSLVASFANLIAYKLYVVHEKNRRRTGIFIVKFIGAGYMMFFLGVALYWAMGKG